MRRWGYRIGKRKVVIVMKAEEGMLDKDGLLKKCFSLVLDIYREEECWEVLL